MDAVELIHLYETLFYVSLGLTILGFGLAVFFFFFFNIRDVRALMTGKARADTVRRIEEQNSRTGTLRAPIPGMSGDIAQSGKIGRTGRTIIEPPAPAQPVQPAVSYDEMETAVLQPDAAETSVLDVNETMVLNSQEYPETMVLNQAGAAYEAPAAAETAVLNRSVPGIRFDMTESTIVIHTNEII